MNKCALNKANTIAEAGERIVIFAGIIHIIIVYFHLLLPGFLPIDMDPFRGSIMGVLFLWLSLGIRKRNREIAVITLLAWGVDTALKYILNAGIASGPLLIRSSVAIGLCIGIVGCFMFRALLKSNRYNEVFSNEIIGSIPKIGHARIVAFFF